MTLTQVGKYLPEGLRAWGSMLNMLLETAAACGVPTGRISATRESIAFSLDRRKYSLGVEYEKAETLWFSTWCKIDPEAARQLGVGELAEEPKVPGRYQWWRGVELDSEDVHFFSRTKVGQMQWLESFLRDCLAKARSIETPDQPPIPDDAQDE